MTQPLVAIAIPSYNNAPYIKETLDSINAQSYDNIEVVIIDDCSTDNSISVIEEWLVTCRFPFKFLKHEKNRGLTRTLNHFLNECDKNALYVSFIGSDDTFLPDKTQTQVSILDKTDETVAMVYTDSYYINEKSQRKLGTYMSTRFKYEYAPSGNIQDQLPDKNFLLLQSALIKKSVFDTIGNFDESLPFEDWDMSLRIADKYNVLFCDQVLIEYRIHPNSVMGKLKNWNLFMLPFYLKHIHRKGFKKKAEKAITKLYAEKNHAAKEFVKEYNKIAGTKHKYTLLILYCNLPSFLMNFLRRTLYAAKIMRAGIRDSGNKKVL